jgi:hypothetical protein
MTPMMAQYQKSINRSTKYSAFTDRYIDSLKAAEGDFDYSLSQYGNDSLYLSFYPKAPYAQLFLPPTFYKGISHRILSIDSNEQDRLNEAIDKAMMSIYLKRPDLISTTESHLDVIGPTLEVNKRIAPDEQLLTKHVAPKAIEPEIEDLGISIYKPNFWSYNGDYYLQFLQNYVSDNWYKGGESNYSMVGAVTLQANYNNKQKLKWENKLEMKLGLQTSQSDSLHKVKTTEDMLRYTGKLGLQATKKWYYTVQLIAYTQFMRGYKNNDTFTYSDFASPLNINLSLGMDYNVEWFNKKLTGTIHLAPAAYNFKYVSRLALSTRYGLKEGNHTLHDLGSECTLDLTWKFSDMMKWKTRLYGYTTYKRAEIEWENTITFQFNKYISSNIFIYPRFDDGTKRDDKYGYWQYKEYASIGFSYSF